MAKGVKCTVEGCNNPVHAKGYCRKHYGQVWRKGHISPQQDSSPIEYPEPLLAEGSDRLRALEREFRKARHMYQQVVGFEGRLKWRKEMDAVRKEIERLCNPEAVGAISR
ncbi:MAG: hypothetical protein V1918_04070 [Planctomycetota bacterium]